MKLLGLSTYLIFTVSSAFACTDKPFLAATGDPRGDGDILVQIASGCLGEVGNSGILLADLAQHLALAHAREGHAVSREEALNEILDIFVLEINDPTQEWPSN